MPHEDPKAAYEHLRTAHLNAVRASLEDHVARLDWPQQRIERYRTGRLRALLGFARERSPFHAARMADIDPRTATVQDLVRLPPMVKQQAQDEWDAIVTTPDIDRVGAECVLAQQRWFSYTPAGHQVFSSGGSSGVRGVYVWDWEQFVTLACLAWRWQVRAERASGSDVRPAQLAVLEAGAPESGVSIHLVDADYDTGAIVRQCRVPVFRGDSLNDLKARVRAREKEFVVETLAEIANGKIRLVAGIG